MAEQKSLRMTESEAGICIRETLTTYSAAKVAAEAAWPTDFQVRWVAVEVAYATIATAIDYVVFTGTDLTDDMFRVAYDASSYALSTSSDDRDVREARIDATNARRELVATSQGFLRRILRKIRRRPKENEGWRRRCGRVRVVAATTDQTVLGRTAVQDKSDALRLVACYKLVDQSLIAKVATEDSVACVRRAVLTRLTDQSLIAEVAIKGMDQDVRRSALAMLTDRQLAASLPRIMKNPSIDDLESLAARVATAAETLGHSMVLSVLQGIVALTEKQERDQARRWEYVSGGVYLACAVAAAPLDEQGRQWALSLVRRAFDLCGFRAKAAMTAARIEEVSVASELRDVIDREYREHWESSKAHGKTIMGDWDVESDDDTHRREMENIDSAIRQAYKSEAEPEGPGYGSKTRRT